MNTTNVLTDRYENSHSGAGTQNKPNQTQLFRYFRPQGSSLPLQGRIFAPSRLVSPEGRILSPPGASVPKGTEKVRRSGAKPFSENGAEKGLTPPADSDNLRNVKVSKRRLLLFTFVILEQIFGRY